MRINMVSTSLNGGAGRAMLRLHDALRTNKVEVQVITKHKPFDAPESVTELKPQPKDLGRRVLGRFERVLRKTFTPPPVVGRNCQAFSKPTGDWESDWSDIFASCDLLNLHWISWFVDLPSMFASLPRALPIVWTLHDTNAFTGGCHYNGDCVRFTENCGNCPELTPRHAKDQSRKNFLIKQDAIPKDSAQLTIVAPSVWLANEAKKSKLLGHCNIHAIPNGIDARIYKPIATDEQLAVRRLIGIPDKAVVAMFIANGVGVYRKGADLLAEALRRIEFDSLHLIVVGSGSLEELFYCSKATIHHIGSIDSEHLLAGLYSAASFLVLPSRQDNLPNTALESIACGTPVVGFDIGGIADVVRPTQTGWLASDLSGCALADAINHAISFCMRGEDYSLDCRDVAVREYSLETQATNYQRLFLKILQK